MAITAKIPGAPVTATPDNLLVNSLLLEEKSVMGPMLIGYFSRYGTPSNSGEKAPTGSLGPGKRFALSSGSYLQAVQSLARNYITGAGGKVNLATGQSIMIDRMLFRGIANPISGVAGSVNIKYHIVNVDGSSQSTVGLLIANTNRPDSDPSVAAAQATALAAFLAATATFNAQNAIV